MKENKYWKGVEELNQEPSFATSQHKEFAEELPVEEIFHESIINKPTARRDFLKMLGFSVSAATLAASCETPVKKAIPYLIKPEEITPGVPTWYASSYTDGGEYCSILVKTREGRPIKIEGNDLSPITQGGTNARVQASVLSLYDTARLVGPKIAGTQATWEDVDKDIKAKLQTSRNIRIISSTILSPTTKEVIREFTQKYPGTKHITYDAVSCSGMLLANERSFGQRVLPEYRFDKADVIVSFGADFLGTWISPIEYTKQYVKNRKVSPTNPKMSRHIQVESNMSLTGTNADHRVTVKPSQQGLAIATLLNKLGGSVAGAANFELAGNSIAMIAKELNNARGRSLVVSDSNDADIQGLVNQINQLLGNYGTTINTSTPSYQKQGVDAEMYNVVAEMNSGAVDAVILYNVNPAYSFADPGKFTDGLKKVPLTISLNEKLDETTSLVKYACPDHHYLESWNDAEPKKGFFSLVQPTISPLFKTRSAQESLLKWMDNPVQDYYTYLKNNWGKNITGSSDGQVWNKSLQDGVFAGASQMITEPAAVTALAPVTSDLSSSLRGTVDTIDVVLYENVGIGCGKHANNPWLQEMPDPVSKITWDNYAALSPKFAADKGFAQEDVIRIKSGKYSIELPVLLQPGQAYNTIGIALGYGRTQVGRAGNKVGKNAFPFAVFAKGSNQYAIAGVSIEKAGGNYPLAQTQTHHHINGRAIVREATLNDYIKDKSAGNHFHKEVEENLLKKHITLYDKRTSDGHHWAMAIDMNACTGCSACVVACMAENNVPVVGKKEVRLKHEMHWLRIDRYYSTRNTTDAEIERKLGVENPGESSPFEKHIDQKDYYSADELEVVHQPMLCQHCDNAPCENVCPVAATHHSSDGLNMMIYNRCIGTRYCANNCPYKVRRFNWLDYNNGDSFEGNEKAVGSMGENLTRMVLNPDVTVRSRGVMEKCSFCVQRIQDGKLTAKQENRTLVDGEVKSACQQACPANAIVFGDINNPDSEVARLYKNERVYGVLEEIHTLPSVAYMSKIRNKEGSVVTAKGHA